MKHLDDVIIDLTKSHDEVPEYLNRGEYILSTKSVSGDHSYRLVYIPKDTLDKIKSGAKHTKYRFIDANLNDEDNEDEIYINSDNYVNIFRLYEPVDLSDFYRSVNGQ